MNPETRAWQVFVVAVGVGAALLSGVLTLGHLAPGESAAWTAILLWCFALAYGANRLQLWLARPPIAPWKGAILGAVLFLPMFLGWFPTSGWMMELARAHRYQGVPSPWWMLALILWGIFAPGGLLVQSRGRLRS